MSTKYPQGLINGTPPYTTGNFSGVWTLEQLAKNYYFFGDGVSNSLRFRSSASAYLNRTPASAGNRQTWTWSGWVKRGSLGGNQGLFSVAGTTDATYFLASISSDTIYIGNYSTVVLATTQVLRDPSAWYHLVIVLDTTQAIANNRLKLYLNGTQITAFSNNNIATYYTQNSSQGINQAASHSIGRETQGGVYYLDGYMADINFIDGLALDPSYFGVVAPATGVWSPKRYSGNYGLNGFYLNFSNGTSTTTLGYDSSGNGNNWTTNNISLTAGSTYDWMLDSPTNFDNGGNGVGNYAVLNPNDKALTSISISNGNLTATGSATNYGVRGSFGVTSGSWYYEASVNGTAVPAIGIATATWGLFYVGDAYGVGNIGYHSNGNIYSNGVNVQPGVASYTSGDIVGVAYNVTSGSIQFYKNNVAIGTAVTGFAGLNIFPAISTQTSTIVNINFGQRPFSYTPPTGYKALNTQNLPTPSIVNGASYMAATTYTGIGASQTLSNAVNSVSFQPDLVWVKCRSTAGTNNLWVDVQRGPSNILISDLTNAEQYAAGNWITALNSNGFTVASNIGTGASGSTYIGWQWKAGGTAVTNTAGSITSSVSANTTAGFSVVTYTGTGVAGTIGHGLGVTPAFIITKSRSDATTQWVTWHKDLSGAFSATCAYIYLNSTAAASTTTIFYNGTQINSSTIGLQGTGTSINNTGSTYVAYCFAAIPGYSAFGSYTGNGSTDGPFVYCGFRPRYLLLKQSSAVNEWIVLDSSRNTYNVVNANLYPNRSNAEDTSLTQVDFLSNGFKLRENAGWQNISGGTYIYAAFAENPFKYSLAR